MHIHQAGSYAATVMGFIVGSVVCAMLGTQIGILLYKAGMLDESFGTLLFTGAGGAAIGSVLGSWGLLRVCNYPLAWNTAQNIAVGVIMATLFTLGTNLEAKLDMTWPLFAILFFALPCCARWMSLTSPTP